MELSVIVPAYNAEGSIERCLKSLVSQSISGGYEIIIVNDGSIDNTYQICCEWSQKNSMISVLSQPNKGVSAARNTGINAAKGEWIAFIDADDFWEPYSIGRILEIVQSRKKKYDLINYNMQIPFHDSSSNKKVLHYNIRFDGSNYDYFMKFPFWAVWMYLYRRDFLINHGVFFREEITHSEDTLFNAEYLLADKFNVLSFDTKVYNYMYTSTSITHKYNPQMAVQRLDHYLPIFDYYNRLVDDNKLQGEMLNRMRYLSLKNLPNAIAWILNSNFTYSEIKHYCNLLLTLKAVFYNIPHEKYIRIYQYLITHPVAMYCARLIRTNVFFSQLYNCFKRCQKK